MTLQSNKISSGQPMQRMLLVTCLLYTRSVTTAHGIFVARRSIELTTWPVGNDWYSQTIADMHRAENATYSAYMHILPGGVRPLPGTRELIDAATTWAHLLLNTSAMQKLLNGPGSIRNHFKRIKSFSVNHVRGTGRGLPVFYPFCGFDLLTALSLFPDAPRFTLIAGLSLGDPTCFLIPMCRANLAKVSITMFQHWAYHEYAWTETIFMSRMMLHRPCCANEIFINSPPLHPGIIGLLVLSVILVGHTLREIELHPDGHLRVLTDHTSIEYFSRAISMDVVEQQAQLNYFRTRDLGGQRVATIIKAAGAGGGYIWLPARPAFSNWVLEISDVVVQDETGLSPAVFRRLEVGNATEADPVAKTDAWHTKTFGNLSQLEYGHYPCLRIIPHWRPRRRLSFFARSMNVSDREILNIGNAIDRAYSGSKMELPFKWGYATGDNTCMRNAGAWSSQPGGGVLLNAWRVQAY